jgi:pyruvate ferredoxin oxidoreductase beta subunit
MAAEFVKVGKYQIDSNEYLAPGHTFCTGCGEALAIRLVCKAIGENAIIAMATGCDEVCTSPLPVTSWRLPWLHPLFENTGAEISGVEAGLKAMMRKGKVPERDIKFVAMGGDGGTSDIGLQSLSGALERGHELPLVCWDNEAT